MNARANEGRDLTREHALHLLKEMLRIRCFEDRCAELYGAGKIRGFLHLYNGEEAIAVGVMQAVTPHDAVVGTYREHGHAIARGIAESEPDIVAKAASYRMCAESVDGMDVIAVEAAARKAVNFVRSRQMPMFLEARTYRFRAHSMYDPQLYRSKEAIKAWEERGPLITLTRRLKADGLMAEQDFQDLQQAANAEIDDAVSFAEQAAFEAIADLQRFVYSEGGA